MIRELPTLWREAWKNKILRAQIVATPVCLVLTLHELSAFLAWVENRPGVCLPDPLLTATSAHDGSLFIFAVIYLALIAGLAILTAHPRAMIIGVQAYVVMLLARICVMYFVAFDPPPDMIALRDPLIEFGGSGRPLTRDLFFSGHTSTLYLLFLAVPNRRLKPVFFSCALAVAIGVLRQHVHYTVDVLAAPVFAFASYRAVRAAHSLFENAETPAIARRL